MSRKIAFGIAFAVAAGLTIGCDSAAPKPGDPKATGKSNMMANDSKARSEQYEKNSKGKEGAEKPKDGAAEKPKEGAAEKPKETAPEKPKDGADKKGGTEKPKG